MTLCTRKNGEPWVSAALLIGAVISLLLPIGVTSATAKERVVERRTTTGAEAALQATEDVSVGAEGASVTYEAPGQKKSRTVTIRYAELLDTLMPWKNPRALLYWLPVGVAVLGLGLRTVRAVRNRRSASAAAQNAQFVERRQGERRKSERRKGERRRGEPGLYAGPERRVAERRQGERRRSDRRRAPSPAPA